MRPARELSAASELVPVCPVSSLDRSTSSTTEGLPVAPSMGPGLEQIEAPRQQGELTRRVAGLCALALAVAVAAALAAQLLTGLIGLITNLAFYGRVSTDLVSPAGHGLGVLVIVVPVVGALVIGLMARYGSPAIRGHGIPEAMEQVLLNKSRIPIRVTFLKPLSAAISIGTGGPFGAEGPIIATGGAIGSVVGQLIRITADERKTLLAAGAAAGMAATFGSPVAAVLLAVELLLFEYRPRSVIPVALAAAMATAVRMAFVGTAPVFPMPDVAFPGVAGLAGYLVVGVVAGYVSVHVTRAVYAVEDAFERLPIHWMWWPALGAVVVGVVGYFAPRTMGVGYELIEALAAGELVWQTIAFLGVLKFVSWVISLGSGTSGGTLAPLFIIGGGLGALMGFGANELVPGAGIDVGVAALVGMAAMFAGASRALLASVVFAFEVTRQTAALLPLLGGCSAAFLVSALLMRTSIMTEKIARRGTPISSQYVVDYFEQVLAAQVASREVVTLRGDLSVADARAWLATEGRECSHQGFPVTTADGRLVGVVTRREVHAATADDIPVLDLLHRRPVVAFADSTLREVTDLMGTEGVGRVPIVSREEPSKLLAIISRSDLVRAHSGRLEQTRRTEQALSIRGVRLRREVKRPR